MSELPPLISVVVACYNGADFLETCVRSALDNYPQAEVIVVDDGSTDDSLARAAALSRCFPAGRMLVASQANQGPAGARNTGIRLARGKYLCFLDVDDQHLPGFLHAAIDFLERSPAAPAVMCQLELINAHRPVETWQREAMERSGPCNVVMRTEVVRQIGGFPVDPAFRGQAGGEDACFRQALLLFGNVPKIERPLFRYRLRPGGYVDLFLDRATLEDGKLKLAFYTKEEQDGSIRAASTRYQREVTARALVRLTEKLNTSVGAVAAFHQQATVLGAVQGVVHPVDCFVLYWLSRNWPLDGATVDVGSADARSLAWLAAGSRDADRGKVFAVGGTGAGISADLERAGVASFIEQLPGAADKVAASWQGRVRLLFVSGRLGADEIPSAVAAWHPHLTRFGLALFHGVHANPDAAAFVSALADDPAQWKELLRLPQMIVLQKQ